MKSILLLLSFFLAASIYGQGFIQNAGQLRDQNNLPASHVRFTRQVSANCQVQLRTTGFSYEFFDATLFKKPSQANKNEIFLSSKNEIISNRLDIDFINANGLIQIVPKNKISGVHYYFNNQYSRANEYEEVLYQEIYPGIDVQFLIPKNATDILKYNFIVHPGADLTKIKLKINGAKASLGKGDLKINLGQKVISESIPLSFYAEDQQLADLHFALSADTLQFAGSYNSSKTLIIDPVSNLVWSTYHGGTGVDVSLALRIDAQNNLYTTGYTASPGNIATTGAFQNVITGSLDVFLTKFSPAGQKLWSTYFGGTAVDIAYAMHVKPDGTVYLAGATNSSVGLVTAGAHQQVYGGGVNDILIAAFSNSGQRLWSTYYGGAGHDIAEAITCDAGGNILFSGHTESSSGIATPAAFQSTYNFNYDVCLVKLTPSGQRLWGTYYGDSGTDETYAICTGAQNQVYITGGTTSISDIATSGVHQQFPGGAVDAFLACFDSTGTTRNWATYFGGSANDAGTALTISNGTLFLGGNTSSTNNIASPGAQQTSPLSYDETFVSAFSTSGQRIWATYFGGEDTEYIFDLIADQDSQILVCGASNSTMNISTSGAWQASLSTVGIYDAFFARYNKDGLRQFSSYFGGEGNDQAHGIAIDNAGKIYLAGQTTSTAGISTPNVIQLQNNGNGDAFLAKFCIPFKAPLYPAHSATYCTGSITFSSTPGYSNYLWSNGLKINPMVVNIFAPGKYKFWLSVNDGPDCSGLSDTTTVTVSACLGVSEEQGKALIYCSPSPTGDWLTVTRPAVFSDRVSYKVLSMTGQEILKGDFLQENLVLDVSSLQPGLYFLQVGSVNETGYVRFIKE